MLELQLGVSLSLPQKNETSKRTAANANAEETKEGTQQKSKFKLASCSYLKHSYIDLPRLKRVLFGNEMFRSCSSLTLESAL